MSTNENLPRGWVKTTLDEVVEPERILEHPQENSALPFVGLEHVEAESMRLLGTIPAWTLKSSALHFWPGDVLYGRLRPYLNKVLQPDFEGLCSPEFLIFRKSVNLKSSYLQYFLNSWDFKNFASHQIAGDRPRVDWEQLKLFDFMLPPLDEQARIVAAIEQQFTRLDSAVTSLKSAQAKAKQFRASLLKSAIEGELTKEWRAANPVSETGEQLLKRILDERRARWEEEQLAKMRERGEIPWNDEWKKKYQEPKGADLANLPELPEGWCWATFGQVSQRVTVGYVGSMAHEYTDSGVPFLRSQNVRPNRFTPEGLKYISPEFHQKIEKSAIEAGDILVVRSGSVGVACVMPELYEEANCSDLVIVKRPVINPYYAAYYMNSTAQQRVKSQQVGIALSHFNTQSMAAFPLPLPPLAEQSQIVAEVEAQLSEIAKMEETIEHNLRGAEQGRQSILREAFAGRLVPQEPADEPASKLLERIREERKKREEAEKERRKGVKKMVGSKKGQAYKNNRERIYYTLRETETPMKPEELFKRAGFEIDKQPESVEAFQVALTPLELAGAVEEEKPDSNTVVLRAMELPEEQLQDVLGAAEDEEIEEDEAAPAYEQLSLLDEADEEL